MVSYNNSNNPFTQIGEGIWINTGPVHFGINIAVSGRSKGKMPEPLREADPSSFIEKVP